MLFGLKNRMKIKLLYNRLGMIFPNAQQIIVYIFTTYFLFQIIKNLIFKGKKATKIAEKKMRKHQPEFCPFEQTCYTDYIFNRFFCKKPLFIMLF